MLNMLYGLLAMAVIIAVLGVINTLAMSVFERSQEIGMLRAIGLDRTGHQAHGPAGVRGHLALRRRCSASASACSSAGRSASCLRRDPGRTNWSCPGTGSAVFLLLAALVGVLAALWPARSAARLNMLTAIKTE